MSRFAFPKGARRERELVAAHLDIGVRAEQGGAQRGDPVSQSDRADS